MGYRDEDRPQRSERPGGRSDDTRGSRKPSNGSSRGAGSAKFGSSRDASSSKREYPRDGNAPQGKRSYSRGDERPARSDKSERSLGSYDPNRPEWANSRRPDTAERKRSPLIPDEITDKDVEIGVRAQLKTLTPENAEKVARHLAMVGLLIDQDPQLAHEHVLAAADRAGRIAMVRETVGCTAYAIGDFALALRELLTHRRISGSNEQIALIVDSERGLGRPDRALEVGRSVDRNSLSPQARVNLAIALSGARLDRGELDLALAELEIPELDPTRVFDYSPALFFAYADVLEDLGREKDSRRWADLGNRAVAALRGPSTDEDEVVDLIEEFEIPVRREWVEESEWQARLSEQVRPSRQGRPGEQGRPAGQGRDRGTDRGGDRRGDRSENRAGGPRGERAGGRESRDRDRGGLRPEARNPREGRPNRDRTASQDGGQRSSGPRVNRDDYRPKRDR